MRRKVIQSEFGEVGRSHVTSCFEEFRFYFKYNGKPCTCTFYKDVTRLFSLPCQVWIVEWFQMDQLGSYCSHSGNGGLDHSDCDENGEK